MSKEKCSKNEVFNIFTKKCVSNDTSEGIFLNSKSGKYKDLEKKTLDFFLELSLEDLKIYCKEMIPNYDCSKIKSKNELIKIISNKVNVETGDLFCKSDEVFDKKNRKCSKKSPKKSNSPKRVSPQRSKSPKKSFPKRQVSPQRSKSPKDEHNYAIVFLKKAKQEEIVTKLSKKNIDRNVKKMNKYIKKMVSDCERRIKLNKVTDIEGQKKIISKYFQKHVMPENILKPLFSDLFSITKYSEENYHLVILIEIFILYILNNNIIEFIDKDFEISNRAELKTKMYFHKEKKPVSSSPQIINIEMENPVSPSMKKTQNKKFDISTLVEDNKPVSYIKYVNKFLDICDKYNLKEESYTSDTYPKMQELLLECDLKFKELLSENPPETFDEFKIFIQDFMKKYILKNEEKIISEFKEIFPKTKYENEKKMLKIIPLLLVKMMFKNMFADVSYTKDIKETE